MGLRDKLKQSVQKTTRVAALAAGVTVGLTGAEARAETTSESVSDQPAAALVEKNVANKRNVNLHTSFKSKADRVKPDMTNMMKSLNLMDEKGDMVFTYDDVVAARDKVVSAPSFTDRTQEMPYTEYEQQIINDVATYLASDPLAGDGKEDVKRRIYKVLEVSGNPKISYIKDENSITATLLGHGRSNYSPSGHIYINDASDFVPELSHAFRDNNNVMGEAGNFVVDGLKDIFTLTSVGFSENAQAQNYKKTGYMEHDTHSIVEPVLEQYLIQDPLSEYGEIKSIDEAAAMIDMIRHQQNDNSAVYTWTAEGDKAVAHGKETLRNRYLAYFAQDEKLMTKLARDAGKQPLLKDLVIPEEIASKPIPPKETDSVDKPLSPALVAAVQNKRANG